MALKKITYVNQKTVIEAQNLNEIQDAIIALELQGGGGGGGGSYALASIVDGVLYTYNSAASPASPDVGGTTLTTGDVGYIEIEGTNTTAVTDDTLMLG